jgi:pimeloyl-ACP methyl ester carboxylesterase
MAFFDNSYATIHYEIYGDQGSLVILVNGYTRPCRDFRQLATFLSKQGYRVLIFDNRGAGETKALCFDNLRDIAFDLLSLADFLGFKEFHLVGFSMGGVIARIVAHDEKERVKSLSLVSTPADLSFVKNSAEKPWGKTVGSIESKLSSYISSEFLEKNRPIINAMAKMILENMNSGFEEGARAQREALFKTPVKYFSLKEITVPTLLIHGTDDLVVSNEDALRLREQTSHSKLVLYKGAGHLLLLEKSRELYHDLASFISS